MRNDLGLLRGSICVFAFNFIKKKIKLIQDFNHKCYKKKKMP